MYLKSVPQFILDILWTHTNIPWTHTKNPNTFSGRSSVLLSPIPADVYFPKDFLPFLVREFTIVNSSRAANRKHMQVVSQTSMALT